jgi:hypothetical protein
MAHDYIPKGDDELFNFAKQAHNYSLTHFAAWSVPSPAGYIEQPLAAFLAAKIVAQEPNHGKVDTVNKNEAKKVLVAALRTYLQGFVTRNPKVTDEDRENMNLPLRDTGPTPHPVPDIKPEAEAVPSGKGKHRLTAINPQAESKKKPPLVKGVAFAHRVRNADEAQARAEDMPSDFQTGTAREYQWAQDAYGKVADYAVAYENEGGRRGPWSDVVSLIIA